MKKNIALFTAAVLILAGLSSAGFGQTAKDVMEKMIEAQGGRAALAKIKDTTIIGNAEMIQMGINGTVTLYQKEPNKLRIDFEFMGMMVTQAFDGEKAWMTNPQTGVSSETPENQAVQFKRQALGVDSVLNPEKYGITFAYKGKEKVADKEYLLLEQTMSDGYKTTIYIDPDTYLVYKTKGMALNQMGVEVMAESVTSDYRKVDDLMVAHSMVQYQDGAESMKMTITKVTYNAGLEDALFLMK